MTKINDEMDIKDEDIQENDFTADEIADDETDWKAKALELKGIAKRRATQLKKLKDAAKSEKTEDKPQDKKSDEFDAGQLAFLAVKGIESDEDVAFTQSELKKHGGTLKELFSNDYFKGALKSRADAKAVLDATPTTTRRSNANAGDSIEYHLAKYLSTGKLPADREMAEKVVSARLTKETSGSQFTDQPVVGQ